MDHSVPFIIGQAPHHNIPFYIPNASLVFAPHIERGWIKEFGHTIIIAFKGRMDYHCVVPGTNPKNVTINDLAIPDTMCSKPGHGGYGKHTLFLNFKRCKNSFFHTNRMPTGNGMYES